jgi:hypothetical protein
MKPLPSESVPKAIQHAGVSSMWPSPPNFTPRARSSATVTATSSTANMMPSLALNSSPL